MRRAGVILTSNANQPGALDTVATIEKDGDQAVALPLNVAETETFPAFRESVTRELRGRWEQDTFGFLVNNAGFGQMSMFEDTSEELFDRFVRVLVKGPYFLTQTLLRLLNDHGAIVNSTSSSATVVGFEEGDSACGTAKGGLMSTDPENWLWHSFRDGGARRLLSWP